MGFQKEDNNKDFICRHCTTYLDSEDLEAGMCPDCKTDEGIFLNEIDD